MAKVNSFEDRIVQAGPKDDSQVVGVVTVSEVGRDNGEDIDFQIDDGNQYLKEDRILCPTKYDSKGYARPPDKKNKSAGSNRKRKGKRNTFDRRPKQRKSNSTVNKPAQQAA